MRAQRSNKMDEVLQGIRIIKYFAWEKSFRAGISEATPPPPPNRRRRVASGPRRTRNPSHSQAQPLKRRRGRGGGKRACMRPPHASLAPRQYALLR